MEQEMTAQIPGSNNPPSEQKIPTVMIGILNWNQKEDTLECIESTEQIKFPKCRIVVVDNGSRDGSVETIRQKHSGVVILANAMNRGAAGGRNDLLDYFLKSGDEYLMFLDNDAKILPDTFEHLIVEINRSSSIGAIGLKAYYQDRPNIFWSRGGGVLNPVWGRFEKSGRKENDQGQYDKAEEIDSVPAGFTFMKRDVAVKVPRMDERYFIYYEDSDWCFKVKRAGYRIMTSEKARAYHKASSSLGMASPLFYYYRTRNLMLFMKTHHNTSDFVRFCIVHFGYQLPRHLLTLCRLRRYRQIQAIALGLYDFFRKKWYDCPYQTLANC